MSYNPNSRGTVPGARSTQRFNVNQTGATVPKGVPVKLTASGIDLLDVSKETDIDAFAGVLSQDASNNSPASIVSSGTIENVVTSIPVGASVYVSKVGLLTNVKPQLGQNGFGEGDFIIKVGMIAMNPKDPTKKDLLVGIQIMGQM